MKAKGRRTGKVGVVVEKGEEEGERGSELSSPSTLRSSKESIKADIDDNKQLQATANDRSAVKVMEMISTCFGRC
jgi:hypothetical protein